MHAIRSQRDGLLEYRFRKNEIGRGVDLFVYGSIIFWVNPDGGTVLRPGSEFPTMLGIRSFARGELIFRVKRDYCVYE